LNIANEIALAFDYVLFFGAGVAGMIAHQAKKWIRDSPRGETFWSWLKAHPKYTLSTFISYVSAILAVLHTEIVELGSAAALYLSATTGFTADSMVNRSPAESDYYRHDQQRSGYPDECGYDDHCGDHPCYRDYPYGPEQEFMGQRTDERYEGDYNAIFHDEQAKDESELDYDLGRKRKPGC